ncbi:MAG: riboflavin synthase, partial [Spirochaetales bacterium]|nr:riboflavin synthase [Spirochaetales bacterium]
ESVGTLIKRISLPGGFSLTLRHGLPEEPELGSSVAVNGVCLTVTESKGDLFTVECYYETARKTTLSTLKTGSRVNLERTLKADGRLEGHLVQGHVSAVVPLLQTLPRGKGRELILGLPEEGRGALIREGSVALDGVSLTIAALTGRSLSVQLIGETLKRTTLGERRRGDLINLETDVLLRQQNTRTERINQNITMDRLVQWGY